MDAMDAYARGERDAVAVDWEAVYTEHLPRVYNYFRFRTGDDALAEDLTAQTFEQAWRGRAGYRSDRGAVATWLFAIARHAAAAHFRRRSLASGGPLTPAARCDPRSVEEIVQRRADLARLHALLAKLQARGRELIELKYGAGLTNRVIAQLTGLGESNVGTTLHRTVRRLRAAWEEDGR